MIKKVYKELGETPLEALERFRQRQGISPDEPMTYAGRLDPMAEGWFWVLSGDDVHKKELYMNHDKVYRLDVLYDIQTDTFDLLGIPQKHTRRDTASIERCGGEFDQQYPPYSSKTVQGKPLWQWAREGRLDEIELPTRHVRVYSVKCLRGTTILYSEVLKEVERRTGLVKGDFRQEEILGAWRELGIDASNTFELVSYRIECSAGAYMRSLAHGAGGVAWRIVREKC